MLSRLLLSIEQLRTAFKDHNLMMVFHCCDIGAYGRREKCPQGKVSEIADSGLK